MHRVQIALGTVKTARRVNGEKEKKLVAMRRQQLEDAYTREKQVLEARLAMGNAGLAKHPLLAVCGVLAFWRDAECRSERRDEREKREGNLVCCPEGRGYQRLHATVNGGETSASDGAESASATSSR